MNPEDDRSGCRGFLLRSIHVENVAFVGLIAVRQVGKLLLSGCGAGEYERQQADQSSGAHGYFLSEVVWVDSS
jgi:hypothetical protein